MAKLSRRRFLAKAVGVAAATLTAEAIGTAPKFGLKPAAADAEEMSSTAVQDRRWQAYRIRHEAALVQSNLPSPTYPTNGDEERYSNKIASFTKCLPHNPLGEVDRQAYHTFLTAIAAEEFPAFEAVPLGGRMKFANPLASSAFELEGYDPHHLDMSAPPAFSSAETAGEMIELYWQALTRDVPFTEYGYHPLTNTAAADLSRCIDFRGPKLGGSVTPATLFRGPARGDLAGPYLSQFLWLDVPQGSLIVAQRSRVPVAGDDYLTTYPEWLANQRGLPPARVNVFDPTLRYLRNGRDLGAYVHKDYTYQAFLHACLILLGIGVPFKTELPYKRSRTQSGFITFGAPHVLDLVARVANAALKTAWCHKWLVHRRLRPEAYAGRAHNHLTGAAQYSLHASMLNAAAPSAVFRAFGSYLLPMAYPEGCPTHPSYPAGHAAIAGACATVLKAFFAESFIVPNPVVATADGLSLALYKGTDLRVGDELNKLAANIALARNAAGVHWRSDSIEGLKLGEAVAVGILTALRTTYPEHFTGFTFTTFAGTNGTV